MLFFPQINIFVPLSLWDWCEIENSLFRFEALISVSDAKFFPFWKLFLQLPPTQIFQKCVLLLWKRWIMLITWMNWQISEKTQKSANLWISYWQNSWNIVGHKYSQNDYIIYIILERLFPPNFGQLLSFWDEDCGMAGLCDPTPNVLVFARRRRIRLHSQQPWCERKSKTAAHCNSSLPKIYRH